MQVDQREECRVVDIVLRRKLIEVALPLDALNRAAAREKAVRRGHPRTLHLWWARRPLTVARAVIFAQMVDDPSSLPELFPTEQAQLQERRRLFGILDKLVGLGSTDDDEVLRAAHEEIRKSWRRTCQDHAADPRANELFDPRRLPAFHDPFSGGGSLPLEAQRLGLRAYASDLNPVAVLINKAMIEIPPRFAGRMPVNPEVRSETLVSREWSGTRGLAEDVRYYGRWVREEARRRIGDLYPKIAITEAMAQTRPDLSAYVGRRLTVIAWIWTRTVPSPNPEFAEVRIPLVSSFMLSTRKGREAYVEPVIEPEGYRFVVRTGPPSDLAKSKAGTGAGGRHAFRCLMSGVPVSYDYLRSAGQSGRLGVRLMAIVAKCDRGRVYLAPTEEHETIAKQARPAWQPDTLLPANARDFSTARYGLTTFGDLFTPRQLVMANTLSDLVREARRRVRQDALAAGHADDDHPSTSGDEAAATTYSDAVTLYLGIALSSLTEFGNSLCRWDAGRAQVRGLFSRQTIPMVWNFAETNALAKTAGDYQLTLMTVADVIDDLQHTVAGSANQRDARTQSMSDHKVVSTDPPYYDNVGYADLSDFFYVWLRRSLGPSFPSLFKELATPKTEELVTTVTRHDHGDEANRFFHEGMTRVLATLAERTHAVTPVTIYCTFRQPSQRSDRNAEAGCESFLDVVIRAGFSISAVWPLRTELGSRKHDAADSRLPASSMLLVCRRRSGQAAVATRRELLAELNVKLPSAIADLRLHGIDGADLKRSALGPGMAIFSHYAEVLDVAGNRVSSGEALGIIDQIITEHTTVARQEGLEMPRQEGLKMPRIEHLELRNFRLFRNAEWRDLPSFTVLVGANGSGKSTLFDALSFLKECLTENVTQAVARRGGLRELRTRGESGPVVIEVKFRESGGSLAAYRLEIESQRGRPVVGRETLIYKQKHILKFVHGTGSFIGHDGKSPRVLDDPSTLAIKGLGQFSDFRVGSEFRNLLERWHISDFQISSARNSTDAGLAEHLSTRGDNVAQVAAYLYEQYPDRFQHILEVMRRRVPGITRVEARTTEDGRLVLRFQDGSFQDPFIARYVSDGTIKMFAYLVLLHDPQPHPVLAVEEPENQLYPRLLNDLVEEFRDYARRGGQVFVSTHSPEFLNGASLKEIYWLEKDNGVATVQRAADRDLLRRLIDEGDRPGELWRQGLFTGADPH